MYLGIDIASVDENKPIDWIAAHTAGVRFAFFRGSYRTWRDPTFANEAARARRVGVTVGAYLFPSFTLDVAKQVDALAAVAALKPWYDFPPALDVEFPGGIKATGKTRVELLDKVVEFALALKRRFKTAPMIYTSARVWDGEDEDALDADRLLAPQFADALHECPLWLARYPFKTRSAAVRDARVDALPMPPVPKAWGPGNVWIHQYQGDAINLPGFTRTADLNRFFELRIGATGERVKWLQKKLGINTDGVFGSQTEQAVKRFQEDHDLIDDGVVGPMTFAALAWR